VAQTVSLPRRELSRRSSFATSSIDRSLDAVQCREIGTPSWSRSVVLSLTTLKLGPQASVARVSGWLKDGQAFVGEGEGGAVGTVAEVDCHWK